MDTVTVHISSSLLVSLSPPFNSSFSSFQPPIIGANGLLQEFADLAHSFNEFLIII